MATRDSNLEDWVRGPTFELESIELELGNGPVAGVDEAGRGPWAGPVVAAAVILDPGHVPAGLDDSKKLDEDARNRAYNAICSTARYGMGIASSEEIDRYNILEATHLAMRSAVAALSLAPRLVLVDGNRLPGFGVPARAIVKGDARCLSIAAASIVAKVTRDRLMVELAESYPGYGFERHKGYGVPEHRSALKKLGVTPIHRRSFKPVQLALALDGAPVDDGVGAAL